MRPVRMLITARFDRAELNRLQSILQEVRFAGYGVNRNKLYGDELVRELADIDVFIVEYETVTREILEAAPSLRLMGC